MNGRKPANPSPNVAVPKINSRMCPANIFAKSRMLELNGRIRNDKISITINKGSNHIGMFEGKKILKNFTPRFLNPSMIHAEKKLKDNNNVKAICEVIVKLYGSNPNRLETNIN